LEANVVPRETTVINAAIHPTVVTLFSWLIPGF